MDAIPPSPAVRRGGNGRTWPRVRFTIVFAGASSSSRSSALQAPPRTPRFVCGVRRHQRLILGEVVAVYTHLSAAALTRLLRPFGLGELASIRGVSAGSVNTIYQIRAESGHFIVRILEDRPLDDALFERDLLLRLASAQLAVPTMRADAHGARVVSLTERQHLSVFDYVSGEELSEAAVQPQHCLQIGSFLGAMHRATDGMADTRPNPYGPQRIRATLGRCQQADWPPRQQQHLQQLERVLCGAVWDPGLPWGVTHGDLFVDNARFAQGRLAGVIDFEMAGRSPLIHDLAVVLTAWAFVGSHWQPERARAVIAGYETQRVLRRAERLGLFAATCFAAARFTATRFHDFELRAHRDAERLHKDYREFLSRLHAIQRLGADGLLADLWPGVPTDS